MLREEAYWFDHSQEEVVVMSHISLQLTIEEQEQDQKKLLWLGSTTSINYHQNFAKKLFAKEQFYLYY